MVGERVPSLKLTCSPLKIGLLNRKVVFQPSNFRVYVSFREGRICGKSHPNFGSTLLKPSDLDIEAPSGHLGNMCLSIDGKEGEKTTWDDV